MTEESDELVPRRKALKIAAATGAAAVVWAEPTIKGFARRPAFATTGSAAVTTIILMGTLAGTVNVDRAITGLTPTMGTVGAADFNLVAVINDNGRAVIEIAPTGPQTVLYDMVVSSTAGSLDVTPINSFNNRLRTDNNFLGPFTIEVELFCPVPT